MISLQSTWICQSLPESHCLVSYFTNAYYWNTWLFSITFLVPLGKSQKKRRLMLRSNTTWTVCLGYLGRVGNSPERSFAQRVFTPEKRMGLEDDPYLPFLSCFGAPGRYLFRGKLAVKTSRGVHPWSLTWNLKMAPQEKEIPIKNNHFQVPWISWEKPFVFGVVSLDFTLDSDSLPFFCSQN